MCRGGQSVLRVFRETFAMAKRDETTLMGDSDKAFPVTSWTLILSAGEQQKVKETLYGLYWRPLYSLLRHRGFSNEDAKEYTQDFLAQILLGTEFFSKVDRSRNKKFRSFLIKVCLNYVHGKLRKKRERHLDEEMIEVEEPCTPDMNGAARVFDYEWGVAILQRVLADVEAQCVREGFQLHWWVFRERVLIPARDDVPPPSISEVCQKYGIPSDGQASNMIVTVKRRFKKTLIRCLGNCTDSPEGWREQLDDFFDIFSQE
jgi:DNA-directed RNA polymerase specialized sigma24 family protein